MQGGTIYIRGRIEHVGKEAKVTNINDADAYLIKNLVEEYSKYFNPELSVKEILSGHFTKIVPLSHRPYGKLYG